MVTQNGSEPETVKNYSANDSLIQSLQAANEKALDDHIKARGDKYLSDEPEKVNPLEFPDRIRFVLHTGTDSEVGGWVELKSDGLVGYLIDRNALSLGDLIRQGAKIKAHMYFEIVPDRKANDGTE